MQTIHKNPSMAYLLISKQKKKMHYGDAGDRTRGLSHAKRTLYH